MFARLVSSLLAAHVSTTYMSMHEELLVHAELQSCASGAQIPSHLSRNTIKHEPDRR